MSYKIGVVSQKGGVGKSTLSRAIAYTYADAGWNTKLADMDINQSSSYTWLQRRLQNDIKPEISVECFGSVSQALKNASIFDMVIFDGAPHASRATVDIATVSDLVILPTGLSLDDLTPTVILANNLKEKHGIPINKICFALCRAGTSDKELMEAKEYLSSTPYHLLSGVLFEKTGYRRSQDSGFSVAETTFKTLRDQADGLMQAIIDRIEELTKERKKEAV